ncbi:MAG: hypothetical protein WDZ80_00245 [Candidatus Paceibacterota bacterium]
MDINKRIFRHRYLILLLILIITFLIINCVWELKDPYLTTVNAIFFSLTASILVGIYFQYVIKNEISTQHLKIMEFKDEYNKSGIIKYYDSFKKCENDLRKDILSTNELTIYLTYGSTVLNTLSEQINFMLSNKNKKVEIVFMSEDNPFILGLAQQWGYEIKVLKNKISDSKNLILDISKESKNENLTITENSKFPVNYSFYLLDSVLYFVPTKLCNPKTFTPLVIKANKTIDNTSLYGKIKDDWTKLSLELKKQ